MTNDERDNMIRKTHDTVIRLDERLQTHMESAVIHQIPPCEPHRSLVAKMWGAVLVSLAALYAALTK